MQDQHKHITGYRDLTAEEIGLMNEVKALAEQVGAVVAKLEGAVWKQTKTSAAKLEAAADLLVPAEHIDVEVENEILCEMFAEFGAAQESRRWLKIGKDNLQQGFMALTRAIAKPTTF